MKIISREHPKLYTETELSSFLEIPPHDPEGWKKAKDQLAGRRYWRKEISDLLLTYNQSIGNDAVAIQKIQELQNDNIYCVFTGQQLGFMGGPAYTILKGITCLLLAREANAIPIFWLATEDHDVGEIDHTYLLDALGNLSKFHLSLPKDGRFVEELFLTPKHFKVINEFLEAVDLQGLIDDISGETSYTRMMVHIMVRLFSGTGLVFVEPYLLRNLAGSFFQREISECDEILQVLRSTTQKFEEAGGKSALDVSGGTNLFLKMEGKFRCKIHRDGDQFHVGRKKFSKDELLTLIEKEPQRFSTNAAARPVLQSSLFPTLAYVAGPTELVYYHQLRNYHHYHNVPMPWVVPRLSATFVTPTASEMLEKCRLQPWEEIPHHWSQAIPSLESGVEDVSKEWLESAVKYFHEDLSPETLQRLIRHNTHKLQRKICRVRLQHQGIAPYSLHYLRNLLHPHGRLQERVINWWEFQSNIKENLVLEMLKQADRKTDGHLYVT